MDIGEAMAIIATEAERQGFSCRQTRTGMWHFRKDADNWFFSVTTLGQLLTEVLPVLIAAGLDWSYKD